MQGRGDQPQDFVGRTLHEEVEFIERGCIFYKGRPERLGVQRILEIVDKWDQVKMPVMVNKMNLLRGREGCFQVGLGQIGWADEIGENGKYDQDNDHQPADYRDLAAPKPTPDKLEITFVGLIIGELIFERTSQTD